MFPSIPTLNKPDLIDDILTMIENMSLVYGDREVSLSEFIRDVKQAHAIHNYFVHNIEPFKI